MGDRGNIEIIQPGATDSLFLYTHWRGSLVCEILADAILKGRTGDPSYFTRVAFQEMVNGDEGNTSYGISVGQMDDNEYDIPVVSWRGGRMVIAYKDKDYTSSDWASMYAGRINRNKQQREERKRELIPTE